MTTWGSACPAQRTAELSQGRELGGLLRIGSSRLTDGGGSEDNGHGLGKETGTAAPSSSCFNKVSVEQGADISG